MFRTSLLSFFFFTLMVVHGQTQVEILKLDDIPDSIKFKGKIVDAVRWAEASDEHLVLTSQTEIYDNKVKNGLRSQELFACHYLRKSGKSSILWRVYDFSIDCGVDPTAKFLSDTFSVTDLDSDGIPEVWLMYFVGCRGDVGAIELKIIMHEGDRMYAMRGHNKVRIDQTRFDGGEYRFDYNFKHAPDSFRDYSVNLWNKNVERSWWK